MAIVPHESENEAKGKLECTKKEGGKSAGVSAASQRNGAWIERLRVAAGEQQQHPAARCNMKEPGVCRKIIIKESANMLKMAANWRKEYQRLAKRCSALW